jgi:proteasome accessory factor A
MGLETEYAFNARWRDRASAARASKRPELEPLLAELLAVVRERNVNLPDRHPLGSFLANGSRFYIDCQTHPELCTPECRSPLEVVRWQAAGERMLAQCVLELEARHPELELSLRRGNVDYCSERTWGAHESYLHVRSRHLLETELIPHLVSRQIYTGGGGFDATARLMHFMLSPRVAFVGSRVGDAMSSEGCRGISHDKDEPLSREYERWHLICGDSNSSQLANYLKTGVTGLLVRLVDAGLIRGASLALERAPHAMRAISLDPDCTQRVRLADGREWSALEIQYAYLAQVERQVGAACMPDWAPTLIRRWKQVLEGLERDPDFASTRLDWAIKRALFRQHCEERGHHGTNLPRGEGLGAVLCEIDMRLGELGPRSLFERLERSGALNHRLPELGDAEIDAAIANPPPGGRAEARGRAIREYTRSRHTYHASWEAITPERGRRRIEFPDPFASEGAWAANHDGADMRELDRAIDFELRLDRGSAGYHGLDLGMAVEAFGSALRLVRGRAPAEQEGRARFWLASALQDSGRLERAARAIAPALAATDAIDDADTRVRLWTRHVVIEIERATPNARLDAIAARQAEVQQNAAGDSGRSRVALNAARLAGARGRFDEAADAAQRALELHRGDSIAFAVDAHLRWLACFTLRARRLDDARACFDIWSQREPSARDGYSATTLAAYLAELALIEERSDDAFQHAARAIARCESGGDHRCRIHAASTFLECAIEVGAHEEAAEIASELAFRLRRFETPYLRLAAFRALARWHRSANDRRAERRASAAAEAAARTLGAAFETDCYEKELRQGFDRPWAAGGGA